jgi:stage II sporulation protein AB (anti-sigma F factor)
MKNFMLLRIPAESKSEAFVRNTVASFCIELNPTIDQLEDIKMAVSEAVTNCVVHAYEGKVRGEIEVYCEIINSEIHIRITDFGRGIENLDEALAPYFTTDGNTERAGIGFTVMKSFMDDLSVKNNDYGGVTVLMQKNLIKED